jgi:hypothetical protein
MNLTISYSDQFYNWSANAREPYPTRFTQSSRQAARSASRPARAVARFSHRTLQTLWQSKLSLSERPRARAQILSFRQLSKVPAQDGLRARALPAGDARSSRSLRLRSGDPQRDLRHQQRATASARNLLTDSLNDSNGNGKPITSRCRRSGIGNRSSANVKVLVKRSMSVGGPGATTTQQGGQPS